MYLAWFIIPAVKALGPDGGKFTQQLAKTNKMPIIMLIAGTLTIIGGILLIQQLSGGFQSAWFGTPHGLVISTGAAFAIAAYIMGLSINLPITKRMEAIGAAAAAAGGPPSAEQLLELQKLRTKLFKTTNIMAGLIFITAISMAIVRYF